MKVTIQEKIELEIQTPSWYKHNFLNNWFLVTDNECICIVNRQITVFEKLDTYYANEIRIGSYTPITEKEFWAKYEVINNNIKDVCEKLIKEFISAEK